ncbi:putative WD repeat-containing protein [Vanrija pseudolonga]|uniref:Purtative WD repeat-containing protein n=1 Tax=Vanrija pseudolonga TaxID=143232 RepID=A0AAF0Y441_9TREE|nr:purtative WD repeat-containing protein [Vanrija pseudolonga]
MPYDEPEEDLILGEDDIDEVYEDEGSDAEFEDEEEELTAPSGTEPMIKDEPGEPKERPDNAIGGTFLHRPDSAIFALALHPKFPNPPLAVSGGQDERGFLFSPIPAGKGPFTREHFKPIELTGHTDSVGAAAFSTDGEFVATGGLDGRVRVWRRVKSKLAQLRGNSPPDDDPEAWKYWEFITSLEAGGEVQWLTWHPKGPVLAAGCEDATVWMWNLPSGRTMSVLSSHTMASTAGVFPPPAGKQLLTTSLDSSLILWNPVASTYEFKTSIFYPPHAPTLNPSIHGITSLAVTPNGALAAVGGAGGRVRLVALPRGEIVNTLEGHALRESVEALVFVDLLNGADGNKGVVLVSAGTDGQVFVFDATSGRVRAQLRHPEPVTAIAAHPSPCQYLVTTSALDRTLRTWDVRTGTLVAEHVGHAGAVNSVAVAPAPESWESPTGQPQAQVIVSAGDEGASILWTV